MYNLIRTINEYHENNIMNGYIDIFNAILFNYKKPKIIIIYF